MDKIAYYLIYSTMYALSLLPLWVLYRLSDLLYMLIYKIAGYRRRMVRNNLEASFPTKTETELNRIESDFYAWFCDYIVETIKMTSISNSEICRRVKYENMNVIHEVYKQGRPVTIYMGHYCNWEWVTSIGLHLPKGMKGCQLYHELESKAMDDIFLKIRQRFGTQCIRMDRTLQTLIGLKREGIQTCTGYIADQAPGFHDMHCWPFFLNHDTPVYTGPERMSRILDCCMVYLEITRPKRGYYTCKVVKIADNVSDEEYFAPTLTFYRLFEKTIQKNPQYWLWSHNRWKRTREEFNRLFTEEQRKKILSRP